MRGGALCNVGAAAPEAVRKSRGGGGAFRRGESGAVTEIELLLLKARPSPSPSPGLPLDVVMSVSGIVGRLER